MPDFNGNGIPWHLLLPRSGTILCIERGEKTLTAVLDRESSTQGEWLGNAIERREERVMKDYGGEGERQEGRGRLDPMLFDAIVYVVRDTRRRHDREAIETGLRKALASLNEQGRVVLVVENSSPLGIGMRFLFEKCRRLLRRNGMESLRSLHLYRGSMQELYGISGGNRRAVNYYLQELTGPGSWPRLKSLLYYLAAKLHLEKREAEYRVLMAGKAKP